MGGGLLQILSYGTQDLTLTGNPEITFFNIIYRRYTNFGIKMISQSFDNNPSFNSTSYVNISKNDGDLLSKIIIQIKLPKIDFSFINKELLNKNLSNDENIKTSNTYYNYFLNFYNKLKNIINIFFKKNNMSKSITYINDLKKFILKYLNYDEYSQFFLSINYFFDSTFNTSIFTNASLFKIIKNDLIYIYDELNCDLISYNEFEFTISKNMDILFELNNILYNKLINISLPKKNIKICWVNKIALYLFNSIDFYIGSNKIYSLSDTYINNYGELYYKNKEIYNRIIGNEQDINNFSLIQDETYLFLPIPFWLLSNYGLAFPLISLQYNSLQIRINTKKFLDCIRINIDDNSCDLNIKNNIISLLNDNNNIIVSGKLEIILLLEYIYLDGIERKKFAQSSHEYLIEQVQELEFDDLIPSNNSFQLEIFHCCKDMFWFAKRNYLPTDIFNNDLNVYNYTYSENNFIFPQNINYLINYIKILNNPNNLFNVYDFLNGINVIINNKELIEKYNFLIPYYSNNYTSPLKNKKINRIIQESFFSLNGVQLFGETYSFFNYLQPYNYYNATPQIGFNAYSFSLKPTEFQPSGSCNMSRISFIGLKLKINEIYKDPIIEISLNKNDIKYDYKLIFQTRNYNVLRLIGGIGATAYTY